MVGMSAIQMFGVVDDGITPLPLRSAPSGLELWKTLTPGVAGWKSGTRRRLGCLTPSGYNTYHKLIPQKFHLHEVKEKPQGINPEDLPLIGIGI